jgi:predicted PurR-regulated permease PerM
MANYPSKRFWNQLSNSQLIRFLLFFACGWAIVQLIGYFYLVIVVFSVAATLAALLNYPVQWLSRYTSRGIAIALVCLITVGILAALITILSYEVITQGQDLASSLFNFFQTTNIPIIRNFLNAVDIGRIIGTLQTGLLSGLVILQAGFSNFLNIVFIAVICVYMLIDGERLWNTFIKLIPLNVRDRFAYTFQKSFIGFFRAQFLLVLFLAVSCFLVFTGLGVKYALVLSLIIGLIDAIPGIGGTLCAIIATLLVLLSQGWWMALKVLITCTVLEQVQDNFISPRLMQEHLNINPVFLFLALFIGERIAGILGVFLAIPIAAMIVNWLDESGYPELKESKEATEDKT